MANTMTFTQLSTVLTEITSQATGAKVISPVNTAEFVSVAQTALLTGYDPIINAISQVLSRTIFSIRPYNRKFRGLMVDNIRYGNHVRKLQSIDKPFEDDDRFELVDGAAVDPYIVNKPEVLQTNFYGQNVFQKSLTIFKDQLDTAFSGPDEFQRFISMVMQNVSDMIEQAHESVERATLANFIGGKLVGDADSVFHLVTEYNDVTGLQLDSDTVKKPENYVPFTRWMFGRIKNLSDLMTERSAKFHINITNKTVMRHTPLDRQKIYLASPEMNSIDANVLSQTYHDEFLRIADYERVNYWQSIDTPMGISVTPVYMLPTGSLQTAEENMAQSNILGVIFDEEAVGITTVNQWSAPTPFNGRGGYTNIFWHFTDRYWNDFTENGIVLLLD